MLQLIAEGKPNKQVAQELGLTFKTVDKHRQHLMSKLDIHDVAGLTRYAIAEGIINSYVMLVVVTQRALESRWVQDEILWARQKNKLIIPVMKENVFNEKRFFPLAVSHTKSERADRPAKALPSPEKASAVMNPS